MKNKTKTTASAANKPTLIAVLLDRSGSMNACKQETISGFNAYLDQVAKGEGKTLVFVEQFDSQGIDVLSDRVAPAKAVRLDNENYVPRGMTPLYDAMGRAMSRIKEKSDTHKILFVTMTDGLENASSEWTLDTIQKRIKELEKDQAWTFVYLGVGVEGYAAARNVSKGTVGASNVLKTDKKNLTRSYARAGGQTIAYMSCLESAVSSDGNFFAGDTDDTQ